MTPDELQQSVEASIGTLATAYMGGAADDDLYEAALFTLGVQACQLAGGTVLLTNNGRTGTASITFRRGPGNLWSPGFTFAAVSFAGTAARLEVHLGVKVSGASGVAHECDVVLLDAAECDRSRAGNVHPRRTQVVATIEAKFYQVSPGLGIGRSFLGLGNELGGSKCSLVFPAQSSANLHTLIARKDPESFPEVEPGTSAADRLVRHIEQRIRNWLP